MTGIITSLPPLVEQPPGNNASNPAGLPGVTYTVAVLTLAQTWTAKQTFPLGNISLQAADVVGLSPSSTIDTTNASNITSGTLPAARLPTPTASTLGGVQSVTASANNWINSISTAGVPSLSQPAFSNISGTVAATQLPNPSATTLGGIQSLAAVTSRWINTISTSGVPSATQPAFSDISGQATLAQLPTIGANTVLGSIAGGTPIALTTAQHTSLVNAFTTTLNGSVPNPGTVASKFLRDDGTWQTVAGAGVSSLNGQTGALVNYSPPQGRLTLTSGVAVPSTSVAGATTVYYTPAVGSLVPIYDGTNIIPTVFAQLSQLTTDATKSPAAVAASSVYDIFVWNDAGTIRATRGPAWTNDTTRSAGTALVLVNGIYLNNAAITNGPAASRGTYVGTIRSNASSTIDFIFGTSAAGGGAAFFYVWNLYNQVYFQTEVNDSTANWSQTAGAIRAANSSTGNRVSFISGLAINGFNAAYQDQMNVPGSSQGMIGLVLDSITTVSKPCVMNNTSASTLAVTNIASGIFPAQTGAHFVQAVEQGVTGTITFQGPVFFQSLTAGIWQ